MNILSSVGASCARDIVEKTLTSINENRNQTENQIVLRKGNQIYQIYFHQKIAIFILFTYTYQNWIIAEKNLTLVRI